MVATMFYYYCIYHKHFRIQALDEIQVLLSPMSPIRGLVKSPYIVSTEGYNA